MNKPTEEELVKAFHLMWDRYSEQVRLIDRDHRIVAGNPAYTDAGGLVGGKCNVGPAEFHKGCRAAEALNTGETKTVRHDQGGTESFWVPVADDYYVHFTNGLNELIRKMQEMNPPKTSEEK